MIYAEFSDGVTSVKTINLYQWDTYQTLSISGIDFGGVAPKVHFCNKRSTEALVVQGVLKGDGSVSVSIPNTLLMEKYDIVGYIYQNTGIASKTISTVVIPVVGRLKPSEYTQLTDEDIAEIEEIELQAKVLINNLTASEYSNEETYVRPNIVYYNTSSYMCISNDSVTGVLPTDTTKWQKICQGAVSITGLDTNEYGDLVFTLDDGTTFELEFSVTECGVTEDIFETKRLVASDIEFDASSDYLELSPYLELGKTYEFELEFEGLRTSLLKYKIRRGGGGSETILAIHGGDSVGRPPTVTYYVANIMAGRWNGTSGDVTIQFSIIHGDFSKGFIEYTPFTINAIYEIIENGGSN